MKYKKRKLRIHPAVLVLCVFFVLISQSVAAAITDLGKVGEVYPVIEPDIREEMKREAALRWENIKKAHLKKISDYRPFDLQPLPKAKQDRRFVVDMTYTLDHDIKDKEGRVVYPRGYTFNPLDYIHMSIGLVVIDGDDPAQVRWFKDSPYRDDHRMKLLLSCGSARNLAVELNRGVFYLGADVAKRLQLKVVPCVAVQKNTEMEITEFSLEKK